MADHLLLRLVEARWRRRRHWPADEAISGRG
jgi:hypothetical protein